MFWTDFSQRKKLFKLENLFKQIEFDVFSIQIKFFRCPGSFGISDSNLLSSFEKNFNFCVAIYIKHRNNFLLNSIKTPLTFNFYFPYVRRYQVLVKNVQKICSAQSTKILFFSNQFEFNHQNVRPLYYNISGSILRFYSFLYYYTPFLLFADQFDFNSRCSKFFLLSKNSCLSGTLFHLSFLRIFQTLNVSIFQELAHRCWQVMEGQPLYSSILFYYIHLLVVFSFFLY
eukprot:TRINITY_DN8961_c1_g1_i4.p1 TRINITY_DN8961_c1_g1~~TRINITY_DN8961_c1_g1_i4.p1  ORF type:complete len:229 (-),score=-22.61 TRINITY_DN8961_c1_g1_i4:61-747(-)